MGTKGNFSYFTNIDLLKYERIDQKTDLGLFYTNYSSIISLDTLKIWLE